MTPSDTASVVMLVSPMLPSVPKNLLIVPPVPLGDAEHAGDLAHRHLDADAGEEADRARCATGSRRGSRGAGAGRGSSRTPVTIASAPASATYCGDAIGAMPARPAARIAAVAESAPTTRCRDEPSSANTAIGMRIV